MKKSPKGSKLAKSGAPATHILTAEYPARQQNIVVEFEAERIGIGVIDPETKDRYIYWLKTPNATRAQQEQFALAFIDKHEPALINGHFTLRFECSGEDGKLLPIILTDEDITPITAHMRAQAFHNVAF